MSYIKINNEFVNDNTAAELQKLCPFGAFDYAGDKLTINAGCKVCRMCINKGPKGVCEFVESKKVLIDKSLYKGIAVYCEHKNGHVHQVSFELIGKAKELAKKTGDPVYAIIIGNNVKHIAEDALSYGVDKAFLYENEEYEEFNVEKYTNVVEVFFKKHKNSVFFMGSTTQGRSFAPRIAARLKTGLTADCTMLDVNEHGDLLQIRPAFGGNIMAKIHTPNNRPQMATVRYKMFSKPEKVKPFGEIVLESAKDINKDSTIKQVKVHKKEVAEDISEAEIIIAIGRAFKNKKDLELIEPLRKKLNASIGVTRPLIENGWFDIRQQIGLSGRTVKPKLIINLGISGAVHFVEGMKESELIITVDIDPSNKLFAISHYSIVGDIYEVLPQLNELVDKLMGA